MIQEGNPEAGAAEHASGGGAEHSTAAAAEHVAAAAAAPGQAAADRVVETKKAGKRARRATRLQVGLGFGSSQHSPCQDL